MATFSLAHYISRELYKWVEDANGKSHEVTMTVSAWARSWNKDEVGQVVREQVVVLKKEHGWKDACTYRY